MKKYTSPMLNVRMFSEESVITGSNGENNGYLEGLQDNSIKKAQVNWENVKTITQLVF